LTKLNRRKLFCAGAAFLAAPAIVCCTSLMPVKAWLGDELTIIIPLIFADGTIGSRMIDLWEWLSIRSGN
jgi:hypothetical protein